MDTREKAELDSPQRPTEGLLESRGAVGRLNSSEGQLAGVEPGPQQPYPMARFLAKTGVSTALGCIHVAHPAIECARLTASAYRVCRSQRGWNLWRFYEWNQEPCGWRVVVADLKTREDATLHLLKRLGLTDEPAPQPLLPAPQPIVTWGDEMGEWP